MTTLNTIIEEENTPDTEKCKNCRNLHNGSIVKVDNDGACVFCGRQVSPNITTPDTEWKKELRQRFLGTSIAGTIEQLEVFVESLITSRDTYWKERDKHLDPTDPSTTRIAISTTCCGGEHQTIAGALLKSKEWKEWYDHASKNMLYDVDETLTIDAMSDGHFASFMDFVREKQDSYWKERVRKEVMSVIEQYEIDGEWQLNQVLRRVEDALLEKFTPITNEDNLK